MKKLVFHSIHFVSFFVAVMFVVASAFVFVGCGCKNGEQLTEDELKYVPTNTDLEYVEVEGGIKITDYKGSATKVVIPGEIDGKKVIAIGSYAFDVSNVVDITVPASVVKLEGHAFDLMEDKIITALNFKDKANWIVKKADKDVTVNVSDISTPETAAEYYNANSNFIWTKGS